MDDYLTEAELQTEEEVPQSELAGDSQTAVLGDGMQPQGPRP